MTLSRQRDSSWIDSQQATISLVRTAFAGPGPRRRKNAIPDTQTPIPPPRRAGEAKPRHYCLPRSAKQTPHAPLPSRSAKPTLALSDIYTMNRLFLSTVFNRRRLIGDDRHHLSTLRNLPISMPSAPAYTAIVRRYHASVKESVILFNGPRFFVDIIVMLSASKLPYWTGRRCFPIEWGARVFLARSNSIKRIISNLVAGDFRSWSPGNYLRRCASFLFVCGLALTLRLPCRVPWRRRIGRQSVRERVGNAAKTDYLRVVHDAQDRTVSLETAIVSFVPATAEAVRMCGSTWWPPSTLPTRATTRN